MTKLKNETYAEYFDRVYIRRRRASRVKAFFTAAGRMLWKGLDRVFPMLVVGAVLCACAEKMEGVVYVNDSTGQASIGRPPGPSCLIVGKKIGYKVFPHDEANLYMDMVGDTLYFYPFLLADGRDGLMSKAQFDSLEVGDLFPGCRLDVYEVAE